MAINTSGGAGGTSGTLGLATIKPVWDQYFEMALRHKTLWRLLVDKRPVAPTNPGQTVTMFIHNDLTQLSDDPVANSLADDATEPTPLSFPAPDEVSLTVREYGRAVVHTKFLNYLSLADVSRYQIEQVAYDMANSIDRFVRFVARGGSNVIYGGNASSTVTVDDTDTIDSDDVRGIVADMRTAAVEPRLPNEELFVAYIHPHVSLDLRRATPAGEWREPHVYSAPNLLWKGAVGIWEGVVFVETGRAYAAPDGATSNYNYRTLFFGKQALAEGVLLEPGLVAGPVGADLFDRKLRLAWYGILGWARYREEALRRLETGSSKAGAGLGGVAN